LPDLAFRSCSMAQQIPRYLVIARCPPRGISSGVSNSKHGRTNRKTCCLCPATPKTAKLSAYRYGKLALVERGIYNVFNENASITFNTSMFENVHCLKFYSSASRSRVLLLVLSMFDATHDRVPSLVPNRFKVSESSSIGSR
jgi:hypothetical protein